MNYQSELKYYLDSFKTLIPNLDLEKVLYKEGTTIGQVTFHCTQAANFWIRTVVLRKPFTRNRDAEFKDQQTIEQIMNSIDLAIKACEELERENPDQAEWRRVSLSARKRLHTSRGYRNSCKRLIIAPSVFF